MNDELRAAEDAAGVWRCPGCGAEQMAADFTPAACYDCGAGGLQFVEPGTILLIECGCCSCLHRADYDGPADCRNDENRFGGVDDFTERTGIPEFAADGRLQIMVVPDFEDED